MRTRGFGLLLILVVTGCLGRDDDPRLVRALGPSNGMVISQVYGGGGNSGAVLTYDYVELFNRGAAAVDITGWSVQYASATGNNWQVHALPSAAVQPGKYFLVQLASQDTGVGDPLPATADSVGTINMSALNGKVALVDNTTACGTASNPCSTSSALVDLVGYGTASEYEGSAAPSPGSNNGALLRGDNGCTETDDNSSDFTVGTWTTATSLTLHDGASTAAPCATPDGGVTDATLPTGPVVVSQIYGAGGNSGATYTHDYVELFNRGTQTVSIGGWSVQYGSASNNFSQKVDLPAGTTLPPGGYYLIQLYGGSTGSALPTPDLTASFNMSASAGKVALVKSTTLLACGATGNQCSSTEIADLVGYGTAADYEGSAPAPAPGSNTDAVLRNNGGCTDTNDNAADFTSAAADPRTTASPANSCSASSEAVVVSQIYGGGGNSNATYTHDYVELFNRGTQTAAIGGWSVQYGSATNNFSQKVDLPTGTTLPPGGYYLIQLSGGSTGSALPTPDLTDSFNMSASAGKVALVKNTTLLACGATGNQCSSTEIADLVGYGSTASDYEGSGPAPSPGSNTDAVLRNNGGCTDADDNAADFTAAAADPRNSAATVVDCSAQALDSGVPDSAVPDAGVPDAPVPDAAVPDAAAPDTAVPDAAAPDAAVPDTAAPDAPAPDAPVSSDSVAVDTGPLPSFPVVISQIYGGGGNSGATYTHDYVELFNRGTQTASIGGWSVQYGSAANNFSQKVDLPTGTTLPPGGYYLVQLSGGTTGSALPTPDLTATLNMSATAGKVALVMGTGQLACGAAGNQCSSTAIADLVGYGSTAADFEGSGPAPSPGSNTNAVLRKNGGCTDTDDNAADLVAGPADPRNSASPINDCSLIPDAGIPDAAITDTALADGPPVADTGPPSGDLVVISQIYGAGGNSGASYTHDYIELFNRDTKNAPIGGWSVQYGSAAANFSQKVDLPAGTTLPPGGYYLIQLSGGAEGTALPTPDLTDSFNMSASGGKVALVKTTTLLACGEAGNPCSTPDMADLVGYGSNASDFEGAPVPASSSSANALFRDNGGCTDTDDNSADFAAAAADPRNSASPTHDCSAGPDAGIPDLGPGSDVSTTDTYVPAGDGAGLTDSGTVTPPTKKDEGCACSTAGGSGVGGPLGFGLVVLLLGLLRRRRRQGHSG